MFRKIILPAACAALLGGCASYGYSDGGYYYGQPSVRYYGGASYGTPYASYPYSRYYGSPYGYGYGYPYGYGYGGYYGYPRYPYARYPYPRHPHRGDGHDRDGDRDHDTRPPWRRLGDSTNPVQDSIRRRQTQVPLQRPEPAMRPRPLMRADNQPRPAMERPAPARRESAPSIRNIRERDVRRGQEP